jgi:hypothetical protein
VVGSAGQKVGIDRRKPLLAMRETVEVLRRLLAMETSPSTASSTT